MNHVQEIKDLLSSPKRIAITTHQRPDGDAMGSSLGLFHYLTALGHKVKIVSPTPYAEYLAWMPGAKDIIVGPEDKDLAEWTFEGADAIFCLDFNALHRINEFEKPVKDSMGKKIMIDHHMDPQEFYDYQYWDDKASSTAEMIFRLMEELDHLGYLSKDVATSLYTGIMTDTGSFRFTSTTPRVHRMVARMMETGINVNEIYDNIMSNSSVDRLKFIGHCLTERLKVVPELNTAYMMVPKEVFKTYNIKTGETEGLVNYALGIRNVKLGVLMTVQDNIVKLSFRSRGQVNSAQLAGNFGGGGHFYASGGKSTGTLDETEKKLLALLEEHKDMLLAD